MTTPKFHNKNGTLTAYAMACGYIDVTHCGPRVDDGYSVFEPAQEVDRYTVRLSAAGDCYDVAVSDAKLSLGLADWEQFDTLTQARSAVRKAVKHYSELPADTPATPRDMSATAPRSHWAN